MSAMTEPSPVRLLGPAEVRDLAELMGIAPTKKLGQNFVIDPNTVRRIVKVAGVTPGELVLEVGPGLGSLTFGLLEAGAEVTAVEIDGRLAEQLPKTAGVMAPGRGIRVLTADAMRVRDVGCEPVRLVANLPYNVSVPVLLHLLETLPSLRGVLVMVQREVGERLAAKPGSKVYGVPSAKAAWYGEWATRGLVSRQVFWPVPNVDSVLVGMAQKQAAPGTDVERRATFRVIDAAFAQRRKMLRQALAGLTESGTAAEAAAALEAAGVAATARGEELRVEAFLAIARELGVSRLAVLAR